MTTICKKLTADINLSCDDPPKLGIADEMILINFEDIASVTRNSSNKQIIEGITLNAGSPTPTGFQVFGKNYSNQADEALVKGEFFDTFDHNITFRIFGNDPDYKKHVEELVGGRYVAIVKNMYENINKATTPSDSLYEIYGLESGLEVLELTRNKSDEATLGAFVIKLGCNPKSRESHLPATFWITSKAATAAAVNALL